MAEPTGYYTLDQNSPFVGKSLNQINQAGATNQPGFSGIGFNPQDFAKYLGINADSPLTAGQQLTYSGGGNSGDTSMIGRIFKQESPGDVQAANAQKMLDFTRQANQPAIQTLQGQSTDLKSRYDDLLKSIKGQQQTAEEYTTRGITSQLGGRGLLPQSSEGQLALGQGLAPLERSFQDISAQAGVSEQGQLNQLNQAIAALQTGNPTQALDLSQQGILQQQQLASAQQIAQLQAQTQLQGQQAYANAIQEAARINNMFKGVSPLETIFNTSSGNPMFTNTPASIFGAGGGGNPEMAQLLRSLGL